MQLLVREFPDDSRNIMTDEQASAELFLYPSEKLKTFTHIIVRRKAY